MLQVTETLELFVKEFRLCQVVESENVVILAEPASRQDYIAAGFAAAQRLGAKPMVLTLPGGSPSTTPVVRTGTGFGLAALDDQALAMEVLTRADFVLDLTLEGLIHSPVLTSILGGQQFAAVETGRSKAPRVLYVCEAPDILARNLPQPEDKAIGQQGEQMLDEAHEMTVQSVAGTDLTIDLTDAPAGYQCGFADEPGRWDHWPSHLALCFPPPEAVNGRVVMTAGDGLFPFKAFVQDDISFEIQKGVITSVQGGASAKLIQQYMDDAHDDAVRMTSHFGWGLSRTAQWTSFYSYNKENLMGMEPRSTAGNFMWSTGPNNFLNRFTPYHLDFPMRDCSLALDGRTVTHNGRITYR